MVNLLFDNQCFQSNNEPRVSIEVNLRINLNLKIKIKIESQTMTMIITMIPPREVEVELPDQVRLRTTKSPCPNTWVNDQRIKVLLKARSVKQTISDITITPSITTILPNLQPKLLFTLEVKDKVKLDLKVVNDPEEIKIKIRTKVRSKDTKKSSVFKVKCRNDERMRCPHLPRKFNWSQKNNK
jgi:hypothetical protein